MSITIEEAQLITASEFDRLTRRSKASRDKDMQTDPSHPKPLRSDPSSPCSRLKFRLVEVLRWIEEKQLLTAAAKEEGGGSMNIHLSR